MGKITKKSFHRKLMFTYVFLIAFPVILSILFTLKVVTDTMYKESSKNTAQVLSLGVLNLDNARRKVFDISNLVHNNSVIQSILSSNTPLTYTQFQQNVLDIRKALESIIIPGSTNHVAIIYKNNNVFGGYSSKELMSESAFASNAMNENNTETVKRYFSEGYVSRWVYDTDVFGNKFLVHIRKIQDMISGENIGSVAVYYDIKHINNVIKDISIGKNGFLFVVDENGNMIAHHNQELLLKNISNSEYIAKILSGDGVFNMSVENKRYRFTVRTDSQSLWRVVAVVKEDEISNNIWYVAMFFMVIGLSAIGISIFISLFFSKKITIPIQSLSRAMLEVEHGNLDVQIDQNTEIEEISHLAKGFAAMLTKIKDQIEEITKREKAKHMADIRVLYEQVKPHFIYNTLDSINWLSNSGKDNDKVSDMVSSLANMLRIGLNSGKDIVSVEKEITYVKNYINIQKMRFGENFIVEYDVDEQIYKYQMIKLLLQPLVENAIIHGFVDSDYNGHILITGRFAGNDAIGFSVEDNGKGADALTKIQGIILTQIENPELESSFGYGLYSIQQRISLYYGPQWGLEATQSNLGGIKITITIPKVRGSED